MYIKINHKAFLRIMNKYSLCSIIRRSRKSKHTTEALHTYENKLKRDFGADTKNMKWCTDITQFRGKDGIIYLSALKDLYDGSILGYAYSTNSKTPLVIETLRQALSRKLELSTTIIHSAMGSQYTPHDYHIYLQKNNLSASMSKPGTPIDNSPIESFFSTIKAEWLIIPIHMTIAKIGLEIDEYTNVRKGTSGCTSTCYIMSHILLCYKEVSSTFSYYFLYLILLQPLLIHNSKK